MPNTVTISKLQALLSGNFQANYSTLLGMAEDFGLPPTALSYAFGTAAGQIDLFYMEQRSIPANSNDLIDLSGTLKDPGGATINLVRVKFVILCLQPSPATPFLTIGNAAANGWPGFFGAVAHTMQLRNGPKGGVFVNACGDATGWPVVAGTGDILQVRNPDLSLAAAVVTAVGGCSA